MRYIFSPFPTIYFQNLNRVFQQIDQVIENRKTLGNDPKPVSPRVICLLQDIVDLKKVSL